jgi:PKD repeat protein
LGGKVAITMLTLTAVVLGCSKHPVAPEVNIAPLITASATPDSGSAPLTVSFSAGAMDSDGAIASYLWTFGDGASSERRVAIYTYQAPGIYMAKLLVTDDMGATADTVVHVQVVTATNQPPVASVMASPTSGAAPLLVSFTGSGSDADGTIAAYSWDFGDGGTSSLQNPSQSYSMAGSYTAQLTVTDNQGATGSASVAITVTPPVNQPPTATASASPVTGTAPLLVAFTGLGSDPDGTIASYAWTFGDGGTSTQQNSSHTYQMAGSYTARLTVTDNQGATGSATVTITVAANQPPTATATASPTSGTAPLAVQFTGMGNDPDGTIASYAWTFGDGGTSTQQNPSRTYQMAGSYTARLTVTDNRGATGSATVQITVVAPNQPPTATATASPTSGIAPLLVQFTGMGNDPDGTIASYAWTFGDGGTSTQQNPSRTYQMAGSYTARLTVTDNQGATGSATVQITVAAPNQPPTATATASPTSGTAPLAVQFTGMGNDPDGTIASYAWTFGDGGTSTQQNPSRTYQMAGSYTARLTVTDNQGATGSATVTIAVAANQPPTATATASPTSGQAPLLVSFTGMGNDPDGTIVSYSWTFGDGGTSTQQNPSHTYQMAGSYNAILTVTDNKGATGSATVTITVTAPTANRAPVANAGPDQINRDPGTIIQLDGRGSSDPDGNALSYQWTQLTGPTVTLSGANTATPSFAAPAVTTAIYTFRLSVTDNGAPPLSGQDLVNVATRVTYNNTILMWFADRDTQPNGKQLGCAIVGCHAPPKSVDRVPLTTYSEVFSSRDTLRVKLAPGGSMRKYMLLTPRSEPDSVVRWIDNGLPEKN